MLTTTSWSHSLNALQARARWAQQPGTGIDPLTFALVDEDEDVRTRAEELYEQQLAREEAAAR